MKHFPLMAGRPLLVLTFAYTLAASAAAAPALDDSARRMADQRIRNPSTASLVIGIIERSQDGTDHTAIYGFGQAGGRTPDAQTVYEIGSVTKTFTALLLAQDAVTGKLPLDEPVQRLLPGYVIPEWQSQAITLRDLATQTSALPRLPINLVPADSTNPYASYGETELKAFLAGYRLTRKPGAAYEYSNLGYGLLGVALARHAGKSYEALVRERITGPLNMPSTGVSLTPDMRTRLAPGHDGAGKPAANWDFDAVAGAGALRSNAHDMLRYLATLLTPAAGSPYALVTQRQRPAMAGADIALAWHLSEVRGTRLIWHNGMTGGYASFAGVTADGTRGVVVLANLSAPVDDIALAALAPGAPPPPETTVLPPDVLAGYTGKYQLAPGFILSVQPLRQGLQVQATGQPPFDAQASAHDEFIVRSVDARLSFQRNAQGVVESLVLRQHGQEMPGKRVE